MQAFPISDLMKVAKLRKCNTFLPQFKYFFLSIMATLSSHWLEEMDNMLSLIVGTYTRLSEPSNIIVG